MQLFVGAFMKLCRIAGLIPAQRVDPKARRERGGRKDAAFDVPTMLYCASNSNTVRTQDTRFAPTKKKYMSFHWPTTNLLELERPKSRHLESH
jgi:hypothetical protein